MRDGSGLPYLPTNRRPPDQHSQPCRFVGSARRYSRGVHSPADVPGQFRPTPEPRTTVTVRTPPDTPNRPIPSREFRHGDTQVQLDYRSDVSGRLRSITIGPTGEGTLSKPALAALLTDLHRESAHQTSPDAPTNTSPADTSREPVVLYTTALTPTDAQLFLDHGFVVRSELALLTKELTRNPLSRLLRPRSRDRYRDGRARSAGGNVRILRGSQENLDTVVVVDREAFGTAWAMDLHDLESALTATPSSRLHLAVLGGDDDTVGFAITGRSGHRGYLQRLAVRPSAQGSGIGRALVNASCEWSARSDIRRLIVNTQTTNTTALRLYHRSGFVQAPLGLVLLEFPLADEVPNMSLR